MEAEILHQIDNIDASMQMMLTSIRQTEPGKIHRSDFSVWTTEVSMYQKDL